MRWLLILVAACGGHTYYYDTATYLPTPCNADGCPLPDDRHTCLPRGDRMVPPDLVGACVYVCDGAADDGCASAGGECVEVDGVLSCLSPVFQ